MEVLSDVLIKNEKLHYDGVLFQIDEALETNDTWHLIELVYTSNGQIETTKRQRFLKYLPLQQLVLGESNMKLKD